MRDTADDALLALAGAGDAQACRILVDRHLGTVLSVARRMLGNLADAEDLAQDVFLTVWREAVAWQPGRARFTTWLYRVTVNRCLDRLRRRRTLPLEAAGDPADPAEDAPTQLARVETARRVEAALAALPERQRAALVLCHYQGLGNIEAARVLAISVEALESLLSRGRRALRERLAAERMDLIGGPE